MTNKANDTIIFFVLAFLGLVIWLSISVLTGHAEAWDAAAFSTVGIPALMGVAAIAGAIRPGRPLLWGFGTIVFQPIALFVVSKPGPLIGVGIFFFVFFALLCALSAYVGGILRRLVSKILNRRHKGESPV